MNKTVGVCVPIYYREEKVIRSVESLLTTALSGDTYHLDVQLHFGINGCTSDFHYWLYANAIPRAQNRGFRVSLYDKWGGNLGKPRAVNEMVHHMERGGAPEYIVSYDSDMIVTDPQWLHELVRAFESYTGQNRLGALCPDQLEETCHVLPNPKIWKWGISGSSCGHTEYSVRYTPGNHGIAGGVLFTPYSLWKAHGGYAAHRKYAADDGHYAQSLWLHGQYYMAILDQVRLIHPSGDDPAYNAWKRRVIDKNLTDREIRDFNFGREEPVKVVVVGGPAEGFVARCLQSLQDQTYQGFRAQVILDPVGDKTYEIAKAFESHWLGVQINETQQFALPNIIKAIQLLNPKDDDILVLMDADDWLAGPDVLQKLKQYYDQKPELLVTYGSWVGHPDSNCLTNCSEYQRHEFDSGIRRGPWRGTHLRTMRYRVWRQIRDEDLRDSQGRYFQVAWDCAFMYPALEMAGPDRSQFIPDPLYVYNRETIHNDEKLRSLEQTQVAQYIQAKPPYSRLP